MPALRGGLAHLPELRPQFAGCRKHKSGGRAIAQRGAGDLCGRSGRKQQRSLAVVLAGGEQCQLGEAKGLDQWRRHGGEVRAFLKSTPSLIVVADQVQRDPLEKQAERSPRAGCLEQLLCPGGVGADLGQS